MSTADTLAHRPIRHSVDQAFPTATVRVDAEVNVAHLIGLPASLVGEVEVIATMRRGDDGWEPDELSVAIDRMQLLIDQVDSPWPQEFRLTDPAVSLLLRQRVHCSQFGPGTRPPTHGEFLARRELLEDAVLRSIESDDLYGQLAAAHLSGIESDRAASDDARMRDSRCNR